MNRNHDDLLWRHLKSVPAFRALLRATEARLYRPLDLQEPLLDLGCGDGHFAQMAFDRQLTAAIDPSWNSLRQAKAAGAHRLVIQSLGDRLPFSDGAFATVISNSVLEHIQVLQPVLREVTRVLEPSGKLVITTPSHLFTSQLGGALLLEKVGLNGPADWYRGLFNWVSRHKHTDTPEQWAARFAQVGLSVDRWQYYFSARALHALEIGHLQGLPSALIHSLTGHWIVAPWESNLRLVDRWLRPLYEEGPVERGAMLLMVARKVSDSPISATLPPQQTLAIADHRITEDEVTDPSSAGSLPSPLAVGEQAPSAELGAAIERVALESQESRAVQDRGLRWSLLISPALVLLLALFAAVLGQSILRAEPDQPSRAFPWLALAFLLLGLTVSRRRRRLRLAIDVSGQGLSSRRSWLAVLGLLLAWLAYRQADGPATSQQPFVALSLWIVAIFVGMIGLWVRESPGWLIRPGTRFERWELPAVLGLFLVAWFIRLVAVANHPFILSGSEASIGLDASGVANGTIRSPFSAAWLTNPTLPLFVLSAPLKLLGRSVLAIRILSTLIGALTVPAIYLVGRLIWGPLLALVAALLLAGSHLHVHYSRLGLTNVWDPLVTLLALALIYLAWQNRKRTTWLIAGLITGLNAYVYTSAHLFPLMLAGLILILMLQWSEFWDQRANLLAAGALALVVALPQLLYYQSNLPVFMDRANSLGVLHSNWLLEETALTGERASSVLARQFLQGIFAYHAGRDSSNAYNSGRALLSFWPSILLMMGIAIAIWRVRQLRYVILLLLWGVTVLFAGALLVNPPSSHRVLIAAPGVYLLIALGLAWLTHTLLARLGLQRRSIALATILLASILALADLTFYFGNYRAQHQYGDRNTEIAHEMSLYLNELDGHWRAYFHGPPNMFVGFPTFAYLVQNWGSTLEMVDVSEADASTAPPLTGNTVFLYLPERSDELGVAQAAHPSGKLVSFSGFHAQPLFYAYEIKPQF